MGNMPSKEKRWRCHRSPKKNGFAVGLPLEQESVLVPFPAWESVPLPSDGIGIPEQWDRDRNFGLASSPSASEGFLYQPAAFVGIQRSLRLHFLD